MPPSTTVRDLRLQTTLLSHHVDHAGPFPCHSHDWDILNRNVPGSIRLFFCSCSFMELHIFATKKQSNCTALSQPESNIFQVYDYIYACGISLIRK